MSCNHYSQMNRIDRESYSLLSTSISICHLVILGIFYIGGDFQIMIIQVYLKRHDIISVNQIYYFLINTTHTHTDLCIIWMCMTRLSIRENVRNLCNKVFPHIGWLSVGMQGYLPICGHMLINALCIVLTVTVYV